MSVLAIHPGDLHLRASYLDRANAPTAVEDENEAQSFVTPSLVTLDDAGAQSGHAALLVAGEARTGTVHWRYRRSTLSSRDVLALDKRGFGLTSEAFAALALRRVANDARAWTSTSPALTLVVPPGLPADASLRLQALASEAAGRTVVLVDEVQALQATVNSGDRAALLIVGIDDDALRLRLLRDGSTVATQTHDELGLTTLRTRWLSNWNNDCATVLGDALGFGDGDNAEFEHLWQDIWAVANADPRFKTPSPIWPLVRQSSLLPMTVPRDVLCADIAAQARQIANAVDNMLAALGSDWRGGDTTLVVAGEPAITRCLVPLLGERWSIPAAQRIVRTGAAYAAGASRLVAAGQVASLARLAAAPWTLGVLGMSRDDANLSFRPLIAAGTALTANASFSVMANRDVQKRLALSLARQEPGLPQPSVVQRFEFGPLLGQGMQKLKINLQWSDSGRIDASAVDAETGRPLPCSAWSEVVDGTPVLGAHHLMQFE